MAAMASPICTISILSELDRMQGCLQSQHHCEGYTHDSPTHSNQGMVLAGLRVQNLEPQKHVLRRLIEEVRAEYKPQNEIE
jgi:hypothetical protein